MKNRVTPIIILFLMSEMIMPVNSMVTAIQKVQSITSVSELKANLRNGQVFLTWREAETPEGTTFNVYVANVPIVDVTKARCVGHHIERHSARDWWEDPASFTMNIPKSKPLGYIIESGGQRLDPMGGLFVHTIRRDEKTDLYFAITMTDETGKENLQIVEGLNSLSHGIKAIPGPLQPIWQHAAQQPKRGIAKGKPLMLNLHSKGGVVSEMEYLMFGDETLGWREGLPIKFSVRLENDKLEVRPTDRVWINRPHLEAHDGGTPAIWTFWYGYNSLIYDRSLMSKGLPTNYTEKILLYILEWVKEYYQPDPNRWYCSGSSMGGCGTISFGLHHPDLFAAIYAHVPIVSYTYLGNGSAHRLEPSCWIGPVTDDLKTNEGIPLIERMNSTEFVLKTKTDLPFVFLDNGRRDSSIPWENNPRFYKALSTSHQGFAVYWDNGDHETSGMNAPEDVKGWPDFMLRFRLDESFPAFCNVSSDRNPGNGQAEDGDIIGWINRGMDWRDIEDDQNHYAITIFVSCQGLEYPVKTDITLRRVQNFRPKANQRLSVHFGKDRIISVNVGTDGRISIPGIVITSKDGVRINISPSNE